MRYVFRFGFALVLGLALMAGCSDENGEGGSGGTAGAGGMAGTGGTAGTGGEGGSGGSDLCVGVDCDDGNECSLDTCEEGVCNHMPVEDYARYCADSSGICLDGSCRLVCEVDAECNDYNECTTESCLDIGIYIGICEYVAAQDGTPCAGGACDAGECALQGTVLPCTEQGIRNAIAAGGGPYTFDCDGPTTVVTEDTIDIDNDVILDGEGNLTVDGNGDHRVLHVLEDVSAELRDLTVTRGSGGGIYNRGTLTLTNSTVSGNTAGSGISIIRGTAMLTKSTVSANVATEGGGVLVVEGTLTINDTTISENSAQSGGGIANRSGTVSMTRSSVSANSANLAGGGIFNARESPSPPYPPKSRLTVTESTVANNSAGESGGGIYNGNPDWVGGDSRLQVTLRGSLVSENSAGVDGGGIYNFGTLTLTNSTVSGNLADGSGGGVYSTAGEGQVRVTLTLADSTVSENSCAGTGGGIYNGGGGLAKAILEATTISNNSALDNGGGAWNNGDLQLTHSTVSGNTGRYGGGVYGMFPALLFHTTVSGNTSLEGSGNGVAGSSMSFSRSIVDNDCLLTSSSSNVYNIESPGNTCGFDQPTDQVDVSADDLKLGPLQDNGGPTETHALLPGSVAIDVIPEIDCDIIPPTDQRGEPRPETGGTMCDVGAFELQP